MIKDEGYKLSLMKRLFCRHTIHQNPVRASLVEKAEEYLYLCMRIWHRGRLENVPLEVDAEKIEWRET